MAQGKAPDKYTIDLSPALPFKAGTNLRLSLITGDPESAAALDNAQQPKGMDTLSWLSGTRQ